MLESIREILFNLGWLSVFSGLAMFIYLRMNGYSYWQLQTEFIFPKMIFVYRDHTRKHKGKTGFWYYIFLLSTALVFVAAFLELWGVLSVTHWGIKFVVIFTFFLIVPLLIYALYNMSKENYI